MVGTLSRYLPLIFVFALVCSTVTPSVITAKAHESDRPVDQVTPEFSVSAEANSSAALVGEAIRFTCTQDPRIDDSLFEWAVDGDVVDGGPTHTQSFQGAGTYTVTCTVTDPTGETASGAVTVTVSDDSEDATGAVSRVAFDYYDPSGPVVNLQVDGDREYNASTFSALDGTTVGGVSVNVTEHESGGGHVELDGPLDTFAVGGPVIRIDNVEFGPQADPIAHVTFDSVTREQVDTNVGDSFTADGVDARVIGFTYQDGTDYLGGGNTLDSRSPQPPGGSAPSLLTYTNIQFDAAGINGTGDSETETDGPGPPALTVNISAEPASPTAGESVQFSADLQTGGCATVSDDTEFIYGWDFDAETDTGDEADTGDGESPSYTYTSPGEKTVTLNVTEVVDGDEEPLTGSASTTLTVEPPQISIDATPETGTPPQTISFSTDPVIQGQSTEWRIDGAPVSTNQSFEHTFQEAGTYDVNVTVVLDESTHSATKTVRLGEPTSWYDQDGDGAIEVDELGNAAADYVTGELTIRELGEIAAAYVSS